MPTTHGAYMGIYEMRDDIWIVSATVETSDGSALHRDVDMGVFTDPEIAKSEVQKLYDLRLLWVRLGDSYSCKVKGDKAISLEPIVEWSIYPANLNELAKADDHA